MNDVIQTTDAQEWAAEWCRIAREIEAADDGRQVIDEGWMIAWFANAIETGRDAGARRWDALPSDEDVEAAAKTICDLDVDFGVKWADLDDHYTDRLAESTRDEYRHAARAALLAVKVR